MITTDDDGDYQIAAAEPVTQLPTITRQLDEPGAGLPAVPRFLAEHTSGPRKCASCLGAVGREEYFAGDYYCAGCVEHADDFPWRTTGTVLGYAP